MRVVAIDPGTEQSAFVVFDGKSVIECAIIPNHEMKQRLADNNFGGAEVCGIEMIASYGMSVGKEVFETCVWIGRFMERSQLTTIRVFRKDIKLRLCGTTKAKDTNIRQALIDKYGAPGTKKNKGPTFGVTSHLWAALAVADYLIDQQ